MTNATRSKDVTDLLAPYSPEVRSLAMEARSFVFKMLPKILEQVDANARIIGYGYGPKCADMVCMLMPTKAGVNLGIAYAMELPDPKSSWKAPENCTVTSSSGVRQTLSLYRCPADYREEEPQEPHKMRQHSNPGSKTEPGAHPLAS